MGLPRSEMKTGYTKAESLLQRSVAIHSKSKIVKLVVVVRHPLELKVWKNTIMFDKVDL